MSVTLYGWDLATLAASVSLVDAVAHATPNARDLAYDHTTGMFRRSATGGRYFTTGVEGVRQAIHIKLLTFLGECFLDTTRGVPHFQLILVKNPNLAAIKAECSDQILAVAGVKSITSITLDFNRSTRTLLIAWTVDTTFGAVSGTTDI